MWLGRKHTRKLMESLLFETLQCKVNLQVNEINKEVNRIKKNVGLRPQKIPLDENEKKTSKKENREEITKIEDIYQRIEGEIDGLGDIYEKDTKGLPYEIRRKTAKYISEKIWEIGKNFGEFIRAPIREETKKKIVNSNLKIEKKLYNLVLDLEEETDCYY